MKGFFQVIYKQPKWYLSNGKHFEVEEWGEEIGFGGASFVAKKHVVHVERFDTLEQHWKLTDMFSSNRDRRDCDYHSAMEQFLQLVDPNFKCTCKIDNVWNGAENDVNLNEALRGMRCTCDTSFAFPVYELVVENFHETQFLDNVLITPKTCKYLLHPREREHMERFLAGTDDAMYDFVHALQYLPPSGVGEVARAAARFEQNSKRQKIDS